MSGTKPQPIFYEGEGKIDIESTIDSTESWVQVGTNLRRPQDGPSSDWDDEGNGSTIAINKSGDIVVVGAYRYENNKGTARVYKRNPSNTTVKPYGWTQLGMMIV